MGLVKWTGWAYYRCLTTPKNGVEITIRDDAIFLTSV